MRLRGSGLYIRAAYHYRIAVNSVSFTWVTLHIRDLSFIKLL
jgi:hypothetical protein